MLPQHDLVLCRGHQYHCHSEHSLPLYLWPAVRHANTVPRPISLTMDYHDAIHWPDIIREEVPMCQITPMDTSQISQQQQKQQHWQKLLAHNGTFVRSNLFNDACSFKVQREITAVDDSTASIKSERVLLVFGVFLFLVNRETASALNLFLFKPKSPYLAGREDQTLKGWFTPKSEYMIVTSWCPFTIYSSCLQVPDTNPQESDLLYSRTLSFNFLNQ